MVSAPHAFRRAFRLPAFAVFALAAFFWLRDQTPDARAREMVEVWPGVAKQVETVQWEGENRSVSLEAKHDEQGRFYVGTVEEQVTRVKAKAAPDAGADADLESKPPEATTEEQSEVTHFVAVGEADELLRPTLVFRHGLKESCNMLLEVIHVGYELFW